MTTSRSLFDQWRDTSIPTVRALVEAVAKAAREDAFDEVGRALIIRSCGCAARIRALASRPLPGAPAPFVCGPDEWAKGRKCCPECTHCIDVICKGCDLRSPASPPQGSPSRSTEGDAEEAKRLADLWCMTPHVTIVELALDGITRGRCLERASIARGYYNGDARAARDEGELRGLRAALDACAEVRRGIENPPCLGPVDAIMRRIDTAIAATQGRTAPAKEETP